MSFTSSTLYHDCSPPEQALLSSFLSNFEDNSSCTPIVEFAMTHLVPILLEGLVALGRALELDPTQEDVSSAQEGEDQEDVVKRSMELRIFLSKHVNRKVSSGIETTFQANPADPVDHLASYFFAQSADEVLNPELDDQVNPLQYLAQFLFRNNPAHLTPHDMPPPPREALRKILVPPNPKTQGPPSSSFTDGAPHTYKTPLAQRGLVSSDAEKEVIGAVTKTIPNIGTAGADKTVTITAIRTIEKKTVLFRAVEKVEKGGVKRWDRIFNEEQLRAMVPRSVMKDGVGFASAITALLEKATLVRVCRGLQISFEDTPELSTPPPTLFQTTRKFAGRLYIIDVLSEPPLATAFPSNQEEKVHDDEVEEFLLLRCRMYDPEFSRYYEATAHDRLPREIKERRSKVKKLVSMLEVAEMDEHTGRPMRFGFPAKDGAEKEREEAKEAEEKVEKVEKVAVAAPPLASPRLRSAFKDAKNFEIALNDATERVRTLPLSSLSSSSAFSKAELDARESVWQLRRDHALLQKRENLQKRFGKSSKKANGDISVVVFRRGTKISGRRVIVSVECFSESINGTLRLSVYDPNTSEMFEAVVQHRDTRGMVPEKEGMKQTNGKDRELADMCKQLQLVKLNAQAGETSTQLILFEKDVWTQKLRAAFDLLPKDFTGRATRGDVLDCLADAKRGVKNFLEGLHDPMLEFASEYLESIIEDTRAFAWPKVSFEEFKVLVNGELGKKKKDGSLCVEKRRREEDEETKGGEGTREESKKEESKE